ncbi:nitrous oxide-stimulated promoter family protein [Vibrio sp. M60_M31a]
MSDILLGKLATEFKTVKAMVEVYCRANHGSKGELCTECRDLLDYAEIRLDRCPYGENKPTCNKCPIHCYKPEPKRTNALNNALFRPEDAAETSCVSDQTFASRKARRSRQTCCKCIESLQAAE